ncbi:MAG: hypothetical protein OHK0046_44910 [Anaerolineae bacterium]
MLLLFPVLVQAQTEIPARPADPNDGVVVGSPAVMVVPADVSGAALAVPVANDDSYSTPINTPLQVNAPGLLSNDTGDAAGTLVVKSFTNPTNGTLTVGGEPSLATNGSFQYTPNNGFSGTDSFQYRVTYAQEKDAESELATVTITVSGTNVAPVASNDTYIATAGVTLQISAPGLLANDTDANGGSLSVKTAQNPTNGTLTLFKSGAFDYAPNPQFIGIEQFQYVVTDGALDSNTATVTIYVKPSELGLISPRGMLQESYGNPVYIWPNRGASSYQVYLAPSDNIYIKKAWVTLSANDVCDADLCQVELTDLDGSAWLVDGGYQVWLYSDAEGWKGPFGFSVDAVAPDFPTLGPVENISSSRPTIRWTLEGASARSSWFQVYLAPTDDLFAAVDVFPRINGQWWISREDVCGSFESVNCALVPDEALQAGRQYSFYIQAWNPGGLTTGGIQNSGWSNPLTFTPGQ